MDKLNEIIVGIDLGTTYSSVAVMKGGKVCMIPNSQGEFLTPSVVAWNKKTLIYEVGRIAKDILAVHPQNAASQFKRDMGSNKKIPINGVAYTPVELSSLVLKSLKSDAERELGTDVNQCVICVPAYFNDDQRKATKTAAEIAGFNVRRILNEPTAAAIAYGLHEQKKDCSFLVFDLGGGTFDVCVMDLCDGLLEVRSVFGISRLGGEDFTLRLAEHAFESSSFDVRKIMNDPALYSVLYKRAELAKRSLSNQKSVSISVPVSGKDYAAEVVINQSDLPLIFSPLIAKLNDPCRGVLRMADIAKTDIDLILLAGGATRMKCVRDFVADYFGQEPSLLIDPDLVVTHGAAIQAALYAQDSALEEITVTDILSHSLGIDVGREFGEKIKDGYFDPIIHRGSVIPVSRIKSYQPMHESQTKVTIGIYEGESRYICDNHKIGEIVIDKIPKGIDNRSFEVRFTYDLNGILEVEVTVLSTGEVNTKLFIRNNSLSEKEIEVSKKRIEALKKDLHENYRVREIIARSDLIYIEADPSVRRKLTGLIDLLETAIAEDDREKIFEMCDRLEEYCNELDDGLRW